jgi:hypothetical protein
MQGGMYEDLLKEYKCIPGKRFAYSSINHTITYVEKELNSNRGIIALLHEIAHAKLGHKNYNSDKHLLKMEEEAWMLAKKDAIIMGIEIDHGHIKECLNTYRKWAFKRATCPKCRICFGVQKNLTQFHCAKCSAQWKVNKSRDRRVMRRLISS